MEVRTKEMSKTYQYRKVMKPLLERKRRARINKCLDELKDLMTECLTQQGENVLKLEKADILEMTVDHLKRLKANRNPVSPVSAKDCFRSGYVHAANEVSRALASLPGINIEFGQRVMSHLGHRLVQLEGGKTEIQKDTSVRKPLKVRCDFNIKRNYSSMSQLSPASSGYGSDNESCVSPHEGLLKIASESSTKNNVSIWRPW